MKNIFLSLGVLVLVTAPTEAQFFRRSGGFEPGPERFGPAGNPGYSYWMVNHYHPLPPYPPYPRPWPYPWPYPYPVPYPVPVYPDNTYVHNFYQPPAGTGLSASSPTTAILPPPQDNRAVVCVVLPTTAAVVWFDGEKKESGLSSTRVFTTPELGPGHKYHYTVKAQWVQRGENVSQERIVTVAPGKTTVVDFTKEK